MFMSNNIDRKFQNSLKRLENGLAEKVENGSAQLSSAFSTITNANHVKPNHLTLVEHGLNISRIKNNFSILF